MTSQSAGVSVTDREGGEAVAAAYTEPVATLYAADVTVASAAAAAVIHAAAVAMRDMTAILRKLRESRGADMFARRYGEGKSVHRRTGLKDGRLSA